MRSTMVSSGGGLRDAFGVRPRQRGRVGAGLAAAVGSATALCGCDPVLNIAGANFPAWMFCVLAGTALAALARLLFISLGIDRYLWAPALVYVCLAVLLACVAYALFFSRV